MALNTGGEQNFAGRVFENDVYLLMKRSRCYVRRFCACVLLASPLAAFPQAGTSASAPSAIDESGPPPSDNYSLSPDSLRQPSVPAGTTFSFDLTDSKVFPNTVHTITVYIPAAYKGKRPACLYVGLGSLGFNASTVFDNLIAQHAMPVTIGIGLSSGTVNSFVNSSNPLENPRFDRSFEFDSLSDRLARFLLEEVIPEVEQHRTPDGRSILLSWNPDDRAIGGASTGAIGAFTVAWERPDAFHRIFSAIGTRGNARRRTLLCPGSQNGTEAPPYLHARRCS